MATHHDTSSHRDSPKFSALFTAHPTSVGETWSHHARFAFSVAGTLAVAAMAAAVHAVLPFLCQTTASRAVDRLHAQIHGPRVVETVTITGA
jgi:hypothetical protein|tara:strand:- start:633 stop:908 length:276 start_codon:yes stop_codon:yes gene_type:complete